MFALPFPLEKDVSENSFVYAKIFLSTFSHLKEHLCVTITGKSVKDLIDPFVTLFKYPN